MEASPPERRGPWSGSPAATRGGDHREWSLFATGIVVMDVAIYVTTVFENIAAIYERRGLFQLIFFFASAIVFSSLSPRLVV